MFSFCSSYTKMKWSIKAIFTNYFLYFLIIIKQIIIQYKKIIFLLHESNFRLTRVYLNWWFHFYLPFILWVPHISSQIHLIFTKFKKKKNHPHIRPFLNFKFVFQILSYKQWFYYPQISKPNLSKFISFIK